MTKIFFLISFLLLATNCNKQNEDLSKVQDKYIMSYQSWNLQTDSQIKRDSVLFYIDELINISEDDFYKIEKIKFLCRIDKHNDALLVIKTLKEQDSFAIELFRSLVEIKGYSNGADFGLKNVYDKYEGKKLTIEENFYKIALDYYFKGRNYALNEINTIIERDELSLSNKQLYELLKQKIQEEEDGLEVLFCIYNL
ncbi:hypothetical protein [Paenimyroides aestuarii]|uniref:Lipoprotein n=1 Tax=Paenimyroides aestuarii TaxID=2968490 RepID=A0ABY5NTG0_9FLAO|nr:hypothetical protein [Paenimyroides aestuarii]UUV21718.1 hypothetical protein NPX36_01305 [Paenimyroides aestuarii]